VEKNFVCGIAGYISKDNSNKNILDKMMSKIEHRGPDGSGKWYGQSEDWSIALGHRRLAIIDLLSGDQPLSAEDGLFQIIYNGELYNFREIRTELEQKGYCFKSTSDTEVLLKHFIQNGSEGIVELNGMFSFAIWDAKKSQLILARDRVGIKPLYYSLLEGGGLLFGSELSALIEHPASKRVLSREALTSYFFSDYVPAPLSMIEGIYKLPAASYLIWENGKIKGPVSYWEINASEIKKENDESLKLRVTATIKKAVENQMVSDVPVGVFLSGGIDSSTVAYWAQQNAAEPINTFSIAFEDKSFDESQYARQVSKHIKSVHYEETCSEKTLIENIAPALDILDEPLADPSFIPTYLLSKVTSQFVKVALGGDGGDELFAGYPTYRAHGFCEIYKHLPDVFVKRLIPWFVSRLSPTDQYQSLEWKLKRFTLRWDHSPLVRHLRWMANTDIPDLKQIVNKDELPLTIRNYQDLKNHRAPTLNDLLTLDFQTYLPGSVLTKVDRASMAWGLEVRPPLLDNSVIDLAFGVSEKMKLNGSTTKYILKETMRGYLPNSIIDRKKKGFAIPLSRWLRGPLKNLLENSIHNSPLWETTNESPYLNKGVFVRWNREHQEGKFDHSKPLWALLVLDTWARKVGIHG
jgi:asparagine synthase (glutamine-hydrolysing)